MASGYRRVLLSGEILSRAEDRARSLPIFDHSHRAYEANLVGSIGGIVFDMFLDHHGVAYRDDIWSTERDYIVWDAMSVDVKTKDRTVYPLPHYGNSAPINNHDHQRPDDYYFVSLVRDVGISQSDPRRFKVGTKKAWNGKVRAGRLDPRNGTKFWTACLNVAIGDLRSNAEMIGIFRCKAPVARSR
jgi:hypothetical protein